MWTHEAGSVRPGSSWDPDKLGQEALSYRLWQGRQDDG